MRVAPLAFALLLLPLAAAHEGHSAVEASAFRYDHVLDLRDSTTHMLVSMDLTSFAEQAASNVRVVVSYTVRTDGGPHQSPFDLGPLAPGGTMRFSADIPAAPQEFLKVAVVTDLGPAIAYNVYRDSIEVQQ